MVQSYDTKSIISYLRSIDKYIPAQPSDVFLKQIING